MIRNGDSGFGLITFADAARFSETKFEAIVLDVCRSCMRRLGSIRQRIKSQR